MMLIHKTVFAWKFPPPPTRGFVLSPHGSKEPVFSNPTRPRRESLVLVVPAIRKRPIANSDSCLGQMANPGGRAYDGPSLPGFTRAIMTLPSVNKEPKRQ